MRMPSSRSRQGRTCLGRQAAVRNLQPQQLRQMQALLLVLPSRCGKMSAALSSLPKASVSLPGDQLYITC